MTLDGTLIHPLANQLAFEFLPDVSVHRVVPEQGNTLSLMTHHSPLMTPPQSSPPIHLSFSHSLTPTRLYPTPTRRCGRWVPCVRPRQQLRQHICAGLPLRRPTHQVWYCTYSAAATDNPFLSIYQPTNPPTSTPFKPIFSCLPYPHTLFNLCFHPPPFLFCYQGNFRLQPHDPVPSSLHRRSVLIPVTHWHPLRIFNPCSSPCPSPTVGQCSSLSRRYALSPLPCLHIFNLALVACPRLPSTACPCISPFIRPYSMERCQHCRRR